LTRAPSSDKSRCRPVFILEQVKERRIGRATGTCNWISVAKPLKGREFVRLQSDHRKNRPHFHVAPEERKMLCHFGTNEAVDIGHCAVIDAAKQAGIFAFRY